MHTAFFKCRSYIVTLSLTSNTNFCVGDDVTFSCTEVLLPLYGQSLD